MPHHPSLARALRGGWRLAALFFALPLHTVLLGEPPPIRFSSLFGGSDVETINDMVVDSAGNVYVVGTTGGAGDFPQVSAHQTTDPEDPDYRPFGQGLGNCFVASFAPDGSIRFSTYLGGYESEAGLGIALDEASNVYVTGTTQSHRFTSGAFPTTEEAYKTEFNAFECAFLASYTSAGALRYSTVYDADGGLDSRGVAVAGRADGSATVLLRYGSTWNLVTFSPGGSSVLNSLVIGLGQYTDFVLGRDGSYHLVGTNLPLGPTANSFAPSTSGGFSTAGYQLRLETGELVYAAHWTAKSVGKLAVDEDGRALIVGAVKPTTLTSSHISTAFPYYGFPLKNAFQGTYGGGDDDAFLVLIDPAKSGDESLLVSTFLGGPESDAARAAAADALGQFYVVGSTSSLSFPSIDPFSAFDPSPAVPNAFLAQINSSGSGVIFSSPLGGAGEDRALAVAVDLFGDAISVAGSSSSSDFHEVNATQSLKGTSDAFLFISDTLIALESLIVNSANDVDDGSCDSAHCSLREAISAANKRSDRPTITFDIPGDETPILQPITLLPTISAPMIIDATTQTGNWVVLDGAAAPIGNDGVVISTEGSVEMRGFVVQNFDGHGVKVVGGSEHVFAALRIGTSLDGLSAAKNGKTGIYLLNVSDSALGGPAEADAILVSGNGEYGICIEGGGGNTINRATVGLDATVAAELSNDKSGIFMLDSSNNTIGSNEQIGRTNYISGNGEYGIWIKGSSASGNAIYDSVVGLSSDGLAARSNGDPIDGAGIWIQSAVGTIIGDEGRGNVISGNGIGIVLISGATHTHIQGNLIGTNALGNELTTFNGRRGIELNDCSDTIIGGSTSFPGTGKGNVISGHSSYGIAVYGAAVSGNQISGNIIGLNADGNEALSNGDGINISAPNLLIGGDEPGLRNIISGNEFNGIQCYFELPLNLRIQGNWIGLDALGERSIANNSMGIQLEGAGGEVLIGGASGAAGQAPGNVISGNGDGGIYLKPSSKSEGPFIVGGNIIGLAADGVSALGKQSLGIKIESANEKNVTIQNNLISGNKGHGVEIGDVKRSDASKAVSLVGNRIGPSLGEPVPGNDGAGVKLINDFARVRMSAGADNIITGNRGGGVSGPASSAALYKQSIYGNVGPELSISNRMPMIVGIWPQPIFPGVPASDGTVLVACDGFSNALDSSIFEIFHSESCDANLSGHGQTWLTSGRFPAFSTIGIALLSDVPATGYLSARILTQSHLGGIIVDGYFTSPPNNISSSNFSLCSETRGYLEDSDEDGVPDYFEGEEDLNKDNILDSVQRQIASIKNTFLGEGRIGASVEDVDHFLKSLGLSELRGSEPPAVGGILPFGYLNIGVAPSGPQVNATGAYPAAEGNAAIVVHIPQGQQVDSVWAHQPSAPEGERWIDITGSVVIANDEIRFSLADGSTWDLDATTGAMSITLALMRHVSGVEISFWGYDNEGRLVIEALGTVGPTYKLQGTSDFASWTSLQEVTPPLGHMTFLLEHFETGGYPFYRVVGLTE